MLKFVTIPIKIKYIFSHLRLCDDDVCAVWPGCRDGQALQSHGVPTLGKNNVTSQKTRQIKVGFNIPMN